MTGVPVATRGRVPTGAPVGRERLRAEMGVGPANPFSTYSPLSGTSGGGGGDPGVPAFVAAHQPYFAGASADAPVHADDRTATPAAPRARAAPRPTLLR